MPRGLVCSPRGSLQVHPGTNECHQTPGHHEGSLWAFVMRTCLAPLPLSQAPGCLCGEKGLGRGIRGFRGKKILQHGDSFRFLITTQPRGPTKANVGQTPVKAGPFSACFEREFWACGRVRRVGKRAPGCARSSTRARTSCHKVLLIQTDVTGVVRTTDPGDRMRKLFPLGKIVYLRGPSRGDPAPPAPGAGG